MNTTLTTHRSILTKLTGIALIAGLLLGLVMISGFTEGILAAPGATITVTSLDDSGPGTLRQAIVDASAGDTIDFALSGTIYLASHLVIDKELTIDGSGQTVAVSGDTGNDGSPDVKVFEIWSIGALTLTHMTVTSGMATGGDGSGDGGGVYVEPGATLTVQDSTFSGNSSDVDGGAIFNAGTLTISNSTIIGNSSSDDGGAIYNEGPLTISNSTITGNSADTNGGALYNAGTGTANISNSTVDNNSSVSAGGGLYSTGEMTVQNSTIVDNSSSSGAGGGIVGWGNLTVTNSTISGNSSVSLGGGIITAGGTATLLNSTVTANNANVGGGIYGQTAISLGNTIVAGNSASASGPDLAGTIISNDYNLIGDTSGVTFAPQSHDITGQPALLGPLADNGGPTQTHFPQKNSPVLDTGSCSSGTDQRGLPRPVDLNTSGMYPNTDNGCDIGAVEAQSETPTAITLQSINATATAPVNWLVAALLAGFATLVGVYVLRKRSL